MPASLGAPRICPTYNVRDLVAGREAPSFLAVPLVDTDIMLAVALERVPWLVVRQICLMTQDPAYVLHIGLHRRRKY